MSDLRRGGVRPGMLVRLGFAAAPTIVAILLAMPTAANAALDVRVDAGSGAVHVTASGDVAEQVTLTRSDAATLRISDARAAVTSADATCVVEAASGVATCAAAEGAVVHVALGGGADVLDARAATGVALTVQPGGGADRLRLGASGMTVVTGGDALDTIDLSHAAAVRARFERARGRVVARCTACARPWAVTLPPQPRTVLLGAGDDDVDLRGWRVRGRTAWNAGAGSDRLLGSPVRRSVFTAGAGTDVLVSWAAADTLLGGAGADKLADLGGTGDVLDGGADIDVMVSLDGRHDTMRGGAGRDMCPSYRGAMRTCDSSGRVSGFEMNTYVPSQSPSVALNMVGIVL